MVPQHRQAAQRLGREEAHAVVPARARYYLSVPPQSKLADARVLVEFIHSSTSHLEGPVGLQQPRLDAETPSLLLRRRPRRAACLPESHPMPRSANLNAF